MIHIDLRLTQTLSVHSKQRESASLFPLHTVVADSPAMNHDGRMLVTAVTKFHYITTDITCRGHICSYLLIPTILSERGA